MDLRNAGAIDKNFSLPTTVAREGLKYYNADALDVYGVKRVDGVYRRMKYEDALAISEKVALISSECAGGRVRFATDSPYIAIFVKYRSVAKVPNYSHTATLGFDLYSGKRYVGSFVPPMDTADTFESVIDIEDGQKFREYTLNFPVCSEVSELYIGVKQDSKIEKAAPYTIQKPIVFYGSSTTQGACASRPGNTYANMISRVLDCDYLNLGFWGNAKGEEAMARYIAGLEMSAFVYDYDYNADDAEQLQATHGRMFQIIREQNPDLPIVILSAPRYYLDEEMGKRCSIIKQTYQDAVAAGDCRVAFISGKEMLEEIKDITLVDNIHPGDVGFFYMAEHINQALKRLLK